MPSPLTKPVTCGELPASRYSVAVATSEAFGFNMPATAAPRGDPWASLNGLKAVPPNWESYIPHLPVVNDARSQVSDCEAEIWGYALLKAMVLADWASQYGAPTLEAATASPQASEFYGGPPAVAILRRGGTQVVEAGLYPTLLTLVPISNVEDETLLVPAAYAFVADYGPGEEKLLTTYANGSTSVTTQPGGGPQVIAGNYESEFEPEVHPSDWQFGPLWNVSGDYVCSSVPAVTRSLCAMAGAE